MAAVPEDLAEPFPIFKLAHHYLLYDIETVTYVRRKYNICGVLVGSLPQSPQQNVFLGLPLELMPEEARLLVEQGVAYVVDDNAAHRRAFIADGLSAEEKTAYQMSLRRQGVAAAKDVGRKKVEEKKAALQRKKETENWNDVPEGMLRPASERKKKAAIGDQPATQQQNESHSNQDDSLFDSQTTKEPSDHAPAVDPANIEPEPFFITPTISDPPLQALQPPSNASTPLRKLPKTPVSYPLFAHMHSKDYFLTPGLRFGCQYMAYPGDPLRFHSHFLCNGMEWDQEFDLLDLVGGGRLGTGVKKGFLIGGEEEGRKAAVGGDGVRTFCVEWAGM